jgi:DNA-binding response OmpR family regulator
MIEDSPRDRTVLVVDPEPESREALEKGLDGSRLEVVAAASLEEALALAERHEPRLVLSELVLPDGSGFALCRQLRETPALSGTAIVLVSQWSQEPDRILAFECGADDFVAKPFFARELSSRVQAVLRRSAARRGDEPAVASSSPRDPLTLDFEASEAFLRGERLPLTPREFALLAALARRRGRALTREDLIAEAWGDDDPPSARSVDAHVKSLRRKLGVARKAVETVRGRGYRLAETLPGA